jgi:serine/threonine-protein kinase
MIDVVGDREDGAKKRLEKAGFTNVTFNDVNDENTPEGYAVSQNVESGKEVPADTQIIISISVGAEELEITDVSGMTLDDAKKALEAQGFKVTSSYEFSDEVEKDKIISQSPAAKSKGKKGDIITLVVSNGKEEKTVKVPDLANLTEGNARSAIENAKLVVGSVTYEYNSSVPEGQVISQNVAAGTEVKEQTSVGFVISNGAKAKTYKGTVAGNISTGDEEFIASTGVVVKIYINDEGGYHEVTSTSADPGNSGSISIEGSVGGLSYNNGSPSFSVTDTEGNDVTTKYTSSLTLSYSEE